jgi:hypothetical protein
MLSFDASCPIWVMSRLIAKFTGRPRIMRLEDRGRFREFSECQHITSARQLRARLAPPENPRYGSGGAYAWHGR